ncbi:MAG TPA: SEC-C metal-binding domain-containing protein [Phycisphaerae bacterium]|nr:SEC-C metal-binding domain-containing protein [Phycisphaerae bacterium]HNU43700.1 SEC-C metal-binding domain-containing protein [Phycisphaerae bacterium]
MAKREDPGIEKFRKKRERDEEHRKQLPTEDEPPLPPPVEPIQAEGKTKRNDPCPCGSGKKYKHCCGKS